MNIKKFYPKINLNIDVDGITANSKAVKRNYIFVAIKGKKENGNKYINEALANGACLIVTDKFHFKGFNRVRVKDAKLEYIRLLQIYYSYTNNIYTVGVTGTDGKTTTSSILNSIFEMLNKSALIGTNGCKYLNRNIKTKNTTPGADFIYQAYSIFNKHNINDLVMEVSSEGILDKRIDGYLFNGAIYTNLSFEHLNTHKTMDEYFKCKAKLFNMLDKNALLVINADDAYSYKIPYYTKAKIVTYGLVHGDYKAMNIKIHPAKSEFDLYYKNDKVYHFVLNLFGRYNIYNALAAIAYAYELGMPLEAIYDGVYKVREVDGRFMRCELNGITGIVDFAHTPAGLYNLLDNIKLFCKGHIILILGAQGRKDIAKRAIMGKMAVMMTSTVIFTSEDPKDESIFAILNDLTKEITSTDYYITLFREDAIKLAVKLARPNDTIVITGKGNEDYEIIGNTHFHHNDFEILKKHLKEKACLDA